MSVMTNGSQLKVLFEEVYKRPLSSQEEYSIKTNLAGFFSVLIKIDKRKKKGGLNGSSQTNGKAI